MGMRSSAVVLAAVAAILAGTGAATTAASAATALEPPPVTVLVDNGGTHDGDIFISPFGDATSYANGAEILSPDASKVIWFHPAPAGEEDADFRVQTYDGQRVLTFWEGTGLGGLSTGTDYIYDRHYRLIATVKAGNGYQADGHEFLITPWNTALIINYTLKTADLTSIGGPANQTVVDGLVQEIDIRTGKVLFQWDGADHVPYAQSEQQLPSSPSTPWDWFHLNAVKVDSDGNLLIDGRNSWTTYKVDPRTGQIIWKLGGKDSSFTIHAANGQILDDANEIFAWQHDPEALGHDVYTWFDNEAGGLANTGTQVSSELAYSRVVTVKLNLRDHSATLIRSVNQPEGLSATSQGNAQTTWDGDLTIGWGALPYLSTYSPDGTLVFNAEFPAGVNTYRAYRFDWLSAGRAPGTAPAVPGRSGCQAPEPGPCARRVVIGGQPAHWLDIAGPFTHRASRLSREPALGIGPHYLQHRRADEPVTDIRKGEQLRLPPAGVHLAELERTRSHVIDDVAGHGHPAVCHPLAQLVEDRASQIRRHPEHREVHATVRDPQSHRVRPRRRDFLTHDGDRRPPGHLNLAGHLGNWLEQLVLWPVTVSGSPRDGD
jgi:hypothetical protein